MLPPTYGRATPPCPKYDTRPSDQDVVYSGVDGSGQYVDQSQDKSQVAGEGGMQYGRGVYGGGLSYGFGGNGQLGDGMFRGGGGAQQQQQFQQGYGGGAGYGYPQFAGMNMVSNVSKALVTIDCPKSSSTVTGISGQRAMKIRESQALRCFAP